MSKLIAIIMLLCVSTEVSAKSLASKSIELTPKELQKTIELLQKCDVAQAACRASTSAQERVIIEQDLLLSTQADRISELERDIENLWRNPLVWFFGGVLVGGGSVLLLRR